MVKKPFFLYGIIFVGAFVALVWFMGGEALRIKNLAFNQNTTDQAGIAALSSTGTSSNKTNRVVQGVLSAYREVVGSSDTQNTAQIEAVLKQKLGEALTQNIDPVAVPVVEVSDLNIVPNTSANQKTYARNITNITYSAYVVGLTQELDIFNRTFIDSASAEERKLGYETLLKCRDAYKKLAEGLSKMPVPAQQVSRTIAMANSYYALSVGTDLLARSYNDPVLSLSGIQTYAQGYLSIKNLNKQ